MRLLSSTAGRGMGASRSVRIESVHSMGLKSKACSARCGMNVLTRNTLCFERPGELPVCPQVSKVSKPRGDFGVVYKLQGLK